MNKPPVVVEIPKAANERVLNLQLEEIQKAIKTARMFHKDRRITVTVQQE